MLYGTSFLGGLNNQGAIFKINPQGGGTGEVLYSFCSVENCADGQYAEGGVIFGPRGALVGTTHSGGHFDWQGNVFRLSNGKLHTIYNFCPGHPSCRKGKEP